MKINQNTLQVSQATYDRGKELFHKGSISKADLAQLESQVGSDKYQLVISESSLRDYKLQLKQLLELDGTEEMDLVLPELADEHVCNRYLLRRMFISRLWHHVRKFKAAS